MSAPAWKSFCKEVTGNALSHCIDDDFVLYDILGARRQLLRTTEACHLIMVRTASKKNKASGPVSGTIVNETAQ